MKLFYFLSYLYLFLILCGCFCAVVGNTLATPCLIIAIVIYVILAFSL